jgi:hypothetical protein
MAAVLVIVKRRKNVYLFGIQLAMSQSVRITDRRQTKWE